MLMATNPGSVVNLEVSDGNKFQYLFIAFAASIHGFSYCRPVISIDATHLKGKYRGVLFTAVCHDANQQIFPLAFGVGDSENDASWSWFLHRVKSVFGSNPALVIVSDRHRSINNAVQEVFPRNLHVPPAKQPENKVPEQDEGVGTTLHTNGEDVQPSRFPRVVLYSLLSYTWGKRVSRSRWFRQVDEVSCTF